MDLGYGIYHPLERDTGTHFLNMRKILKNLRNFVWLKNFDLVLVCGLYKTGTSLITKLIEEYLYFFNPASITNPKERGYAKYLTRYPTKECKLLRQINFQLSSINSFHKHDFDFNLIKHKLIYEYLHLWSPPIVLKDPLFVYTLKTWLEISKKYNIKVIVIFTFREIDDMLEAWESAPITANLLKKDSYKMMRRDMQEQVLNCYNLKVPFISFDIQEIKQMNSSFVCKAEQSIDTQLDKTEGRLDKLYTRFDQHSEPMCFLFETQG